MTAGLGAQSAQTILGAYATESASGVVESTPDEYIIFAKDVAPDTKQPSTFRPVAGMDFKQMPLKGRQSWGMSMAMFPIISSTGATGTPNNGLPRMITDMFGGEYAGSPTALVADKVFLHHIPWQVAFKTFTAWLHYQTDKNDRIRMCGMDSFDVEINDKNEVISTFKALGAQIIKGTDTLSGFGAPTVTGGNILDVTKASQLVGAAMRLEFGEPQAAIRFAYTDVKPVFKRNLDFGPPGKPGQHPAGAGSAQILSSKGSDITLGLNLRDTDFEEIERAYDPTTGVPTALQLTDNVAALKARISLFGKILYAGINGEADYGNLGTIAAAFAGTYAGPGSVATVPTIGEIQLEHAPYTYVSAVIAEGPMFFKAKTSGVTIHIDVPVGAGAVLSCSVSTKEVDVVTATGEAGIGTSTAQQIVDIINATPEAAALMEAGVAEGSTGTGVILVDVTSQALALGIVDVFKFRYTTDGTLWSAWSGWRYVSKAAQPLVYGLTATFNDDDLSITGDKFYFASHYREMLRFVIPNLFYSDLPVVKFANNIRTADINFVHSSATTADRPYIDIINDEEHAYT